MRSVLSPEECNSLAAIYEADEWFRSRIMMAHRGFGYAKYKYFARSLPDVVTSLRVALYPRLSGVANRWNETVAPVCAIRDTFPVSVSNIRHRPRSGSTR
jgi:uncharacterized protein